MVEINVLNSRIATGDVLSGQPFQRFPTEDIS